MKVISSLARVSNATRAIVRKILAVLYWLYALGILAAFSSHVQLRMTSSHHVGEIVLVTVILFYSFLGDFGWLSLGVDLLYIYVFPLLIAYQLVRLVVLSVRLLYKSTVPHKPEKTATVVDPTPPTQATTATSPESTTVPVTKQAVAIYLLRPFLNFGSLWCAVILLSHHRFLTRMAIVAALLTTCVSVYTFTRYLLSTSKWLDLFKGNLASVVKRTIDNISANVGGDFDEQLKKEASTLRVYESLINYLRNWPIIEKWAYVLSVAVTIPYYLYVSLILAVVYWGISRDSGVSWSLSDAVTTSIVLPFDFSDLPHLLVVRLIGACQIAASVYVGFEAIFRRFRKDARGLAQLAQELGPSIESVVLQERLVIIEKTGPAQKA
jgi:hypothetical protein